MSNIFKKFINIFLLFLFGLNFSTNLNAALRPKLNSRKLSVPIDSDSLFHRSYLLERDLEEREEEIVGLKRDLASKEEEFVQMQIEEERCEEDKTSLRVSIEELERLLRESNGRVLELKRELEELRNDRNSEPEVQGEFPSYILLPDLLNLNLESFCKKFKDFLVSRISYFDFNSKQPGRSLYFFFAGLLSGLKKNRLFDVYIKTSSLDSSFESVFYIEKDGKLFLKIYLKGLTQREALSENFKGRIQTILYNRRQENCSTLSLFYFKHNLISSYSIKKGDDFESLFLNELLFNSFNDFEKEMEGSYENLNSLWVYYREPERFQNEKDFHLFLYGIVSCIERLEYLNSNVERGRGRLDIMFKYMTIDRFLTKYVIELKQTKKKKIDLNELKVELAFNQVNRMGYGEYTPARRRSDQIIESVISLNITTFDVTFKKNKLTRKERI